MTTLVNTSRRAFHLPVKNRPDSSEKFGERVMLPGASVNPKTRASTPGELEVPDWYLDELMREPGWRKRLDHGGEVRLKGHTLQPASAPAVEEVRALKRRARDAEREADSLSRNNAQLEARVRELEAKLASKPAEPSTDDSKTQVEPSKAKSKS